MLKLPLKIKERCIEEAMYLLYKNCSIRECAKHFKLSKSSVHLDVSCRLKNVDNLLYEKVKILLKKNFENKHLKGGEITKNKYKKLKENLIK